MNSLLPSWLKSPPDKAELPVSATAGIADHETRIRAVAQSAVTEADLAPLRADVEALKRGRWPLLALGRVDRCCRSGGGCGSADEPLGTPRPRPASAGRGRLGVL
ncbi:hypothetical protein [Kitasatospora paracochleata]|uniref:Uncharacterized protein n=1 Tax=Kitasatospora paracochleata TaxID=58354 RepID=A0ABT1IZH4_9ACTN|nr:hypothetical protein [Kitasatospora paracochleata]MCP2310562.1 hypothetical protein [Kitasatospora paracochleata]